MKVFLVILVIILVVIIAIVVFPIIAGRSPGGSFTGQSLFKSEDGGLSWKNLEKFPGGEITALVLDSKDKDVLIIGTERRGVWKGRKNGENWEQYPESLGEGSKVFDFIRAASWNDFAALVFYTNRGRVISLKEDKRTELLFTPLEQFAFFKGKASSDRKVMRVIGSDGGFYESSDGGKSWSVLSRFREGLTLFEANSKNPSELWASDARGSLYHSENGGRNWEDFSEGLRDFPGAENAKIIHYEPSSGILYHGSRFGLLESSDKGRSWDAAPLPVPAEILPVTSITFDPKDSRKIFVGVLNQLYISGDRGRSWQAVKIPAGGAVSAVAIDPENTSHVFLGLKAAERVR